MRKNLFAPFILRKSLDHFLVSLKLVFGYIRSIADLKYVYSVASYRNLKTIDAACDICRNPDYFERRAFLVGSGPSVATFAKELETNDQLRNLYNNSFKVVLNTTVFSGLDFDLALVELFSTRFARTSFNQLFEMQLHNRGSANNSLLAFTNVTLDTLDDYVSNDILDRVAVVPELAINLPVKSTKSSNLFLLALLRVHTALARLRLVPICLFARSSSVRAVGLLHAAGFKQITFVGFDGGTEYYYHNKNRWPELQVLRKLYSWTYNRPTSELPELRRGSKRLKKVSSPSSTVHATDDVNSSEYTATLLINALCDLNGIKRTYFS